MLMIGLYLSGQYSGYLSSACENAFVAVEKKTKQPQNNQKKIWNNKIQKSTLVDLSAISDDLVGRGKGGVTSPPPPRRLRTNNNRREVARSVSQKNIVFVWVLCFFLFFLTQADAEQ